MNRIAFSLFIAGCTPDSSNNSKPDDVQPTDPTLPNTSVSSPTVPGAPTWYQDLRPLIQERCGACHVAGGVGPFSVETYEEVLPWSAAIDAAVQSGRMPPFFAATQTPVCNMEVGFQEDVRLSEAEKALVAAWVAAGSPEGDPNRAVPAQMPAPIDLADVDAEYSIQEDFVVEGTDDIYQCFRIPLGLDRDIWITGLQIVPGNAKIVHHVLVWTDPNDNSASRAGSDGTYGCSGFPDLLPTEMIGAWAPGGQPPEMPPGSGAPLPAGGSLVLNIHYHPTGTTTELDRTQIRLRWEEERPSARASFSLIDLPFGSILQPGPGDEGIFPEFRIPAGASEHLESSERRRFSSDARIFAVAPHMHYLGTEMLVTLDQGEDGERCLLHTPTFRFDWQQGYAYDPTTGELPVWRRGDRIRVQCLYNNTESNPFMPLHLEASGASAPHDVGWGEETGDEMCMAMVGLIEPF